MTDTQTAATPDAVMTIEELRTRYDALIDGGISKGVRPEEIVTQRSKGHELITRIHMEGLDVTGVQGDEYGPVEFIMRDGVIRQHPGLKGFKVQVRSRKNNLYRTEDEATTDPVSIIRTYLDVVVPRAAAVNAREEEEDRARQDELDAVKARDDTVIAAYEGLPPEMRDGLKTMLAYVALAERRSSRGFHRGGPPIATMLLMTLKDTEERGMPELDERNRFSRW